MHQFLPPQSGFLLAVRKQETRLLGKKLLRQGTRSAWLYWVSVSPDIAEVWVKTLETALESC